MPVTTKRNHGDAKETSVRLPPEVNRILYVRNLPYKISGEEMYDIFGKYGAIRQIRVGNTPETRGTAFAFMKTYLMPKMPVIICLASTSATATLSSCTTSLPRLSNEWTKTRKRKKLTESKRSTVCPMTEVYQVPKPCCSLFTCIQ
uniref:Putative 14 kDa subunit splicing factor 3b n=1 Tax=Rhipicephalus microplus TaxID=6941 RepID=A0A6G5AF68_RHIMP